MMREKIIKELSEVYKEEEIEIKDIIKTTYEIGKYKKMKINNRDVIDKYQIPKNELISLEYYKSLINKFGRVRYPNRSNIMKELMNIMPNLNCYKFYTIYKFDFERFFYEINPSKSFDILNRLIPLRTYEHEFLKKYTKNRNDLIPGIGLHNALVEISGFKFDFQVKQVFRDHGLVYYSRYVDDCILILDEVIDESVIEAKIKDIMKNYFGEYLTINEEKTDLYNSNSDAYTISYLGYNFQKPQSDAKHFKFGISEEKIGKYNKKINFIVNDYKHNKCIDLLNLRLDAFYKRIVFWGRRAESNQFRWQVRGISDSYKELKRFMHGPSRMNKISSETERLFKSTIKTSFRRNGVDIPAKIYYQLQNNKFKASFINNRAIILHRKIGLNYQQVLQMYNTISKDKARDGQLNYYELCEKLFKKLA